MDKYVWNDCAFIAVITIPKYSNRLEKLLINLKHHTLPLPYIFLGETYSNNYSKSVSQNDIIFKNHKNLIKWFINNNLHKKWHLFVLEDDAQFIGSNVEGKMVKALTWLNNNTQTWVSLYLGSTPLGPILPIGHNLCYTTFPFAAHAYILNKNTIKNINPKKWSRPYFFEGSLSVPVYNKFSIFPSVCIQNVTPIEMRKIPFIRNIKYRTGETFMTCVALLETLTIFMCIIYSNLLLYLLFKQCKNFYSFL